MSENSQHAQLKVAAALIRSRQHKEAANLLAPYLKENPNSDEGWLLLSYAVQDPKQKQECLMRAQKLNPDNIRVKERLAKLQGETSEYKSQKLITPPQLSKQPSKIRRRLLIGFVLILSLGIIAVFLFFGIQRFFPGFIGGETRANPTPPRDSISQLDSIATQTSQPIQKTTNTVTPLPSPTPSSTPLPTALPTTIPPIPTYDFSAPSGELGQEMDHVQNQVSTIRELGILADNPRYVLPPSKVHGLLKDLFLARHSRDEVKNEARVLTALGLIEPSFDLFEKTIKDIGEGLGGFYIPWTDELFLIGDKFSALEKFIFAHEFVHALTDQHFHIEAIGVYPECIYDADRCLAISALIEGDATFLMYQWLEAYATDAEILDIENAEFSPIEKIITSSDFPPPYMIRDTYFKYFDGLIFVETLFEKGGWTAVNNAYKNPPLTTEQILHPEKYLNREGPYQVELIPLEGILDKDWQHIKTDTLGELNTQMILGYSANYLVQIDPIEASEAAAGWSGDQYQVFYRSKTDHNLLVSQWRWDSQVDSVEFWDALTTYMNRRYMGRTVAESDESCWTMVNDHYSCIFRTSRNTLWVMAPEWETLQLILDQYPQFQH